MFHEVRFPATLSFGSSGGPERRTEVVTLANGQEERNTPWVHSRRSYDAGLSLRALEDIEALVAFFEARRGRLHGFRWKDWSDYKSCPASARPGSRDQLIALGDGVSDRFRLAKTYGEGASAYVRPIHKPVEGTVTVAVQGEPLQEGLHFSVDCETGFVHLEHPPEQGVEITAGFEFDVPVRFDTDTIRTSVASFRAGEALSVPVVELRL